MTDLQKHLLMLLKEIDSICRENKIEYYLAAGTALGAARHQGFIPWDDDADIYMTDENWRKFYSVRNQIPKGRKVISVEEDFSAGYTVNRYVDLTTTRLYRYLCASPQDAGIIVDILVLDPVPDDPPKIREHIVDLTDYTNILTVAHRHTQQCPYPLHYEENVLQCKKEGREAVLKKLQKRTVEKFRDTEGGVLVQRDAVVPHVWKQEIFGRPRYVPFEDTELPVAEKLYEQLSGAFDEDWMYIPKSAGRALHRKGYNLNISNNNAYEDYLSLVDPKKVAKLYAQRQHYGNLAGLLHRDQTVARFPITETALVYYYKKLNTPLSEVRTMLDKGDYDGLDTYFRRYREVQCHRDLIGDVRETGWLRSQDPYYIHISDDFLYLFMRYCLHEENTFAKMNRILEGREGDRAPTEKVTELRTLLDTIRRCCSLMEIGSYEEVLSIAGPLSKKYPENLLLKRLTFAARYFTSSDEEVRQMYDELNRMAEQRSKVRLSGEPGSRETGLREVEIDQAETVETDEEEPAIGLDSVLLAILADIELKKGNQDRALAYYDVICRTSSHGLVLLYIYNTTKELAGETANGTDGDTENDSGDAQTAAGRTRTKAIAGNPDALSVHRAAGRRMGIIYEDEPAEEAPELLPEREMNDHQEVLLKLLHEIDEICSEHEIRYYLGGKSALAAVRSGGFEKDMTCLHLMMDGVNMKKFMDAVADAGRDDRYLESMLNNEDFPTTAAFYGDLNTVDFMTWTWHVYQKHGIHVTIHLLREKEHSRAAAKNNVIMENIWTFRDAPRMEGSKRRFYQMAGRFCEKRDRKKMAETLFDAFTKDENHSAGKYFIRSRKSNKRIYFDRELFSGVRMAPFEDMQVPLPKDPEAYLKARFGNNWMKVKTKGNVIAAQHLVYTEISCEELYSELDRRGVDTEKIWKLRKSYEKAEWEYKIVNEEVHKVWERLFFSGDRYNLWEYYEPKKEELKALYEREDWGGLLTALDEYRRLAELYAAEGLGLCFDKDIFKYLEAALKHSGDKKLIRLGEGLREKVPAQHWQPIRLKTFDGRYLMD